MTVDVAEIRRIVLSKSPPYLIRPDLDEQEISRFVADLPGAAVYWIDGCRCESLSECFAEFARALAFPDYFGRNWAALDECLADLDWIDSPVIVLIIRNAARLLVNEPPKQLEILTEILHGAAEGWSKETEDGIPRRSRAFHVILLD